MKSRTSFSFVRSCPRDPDRRRRSRARPGRARRVRRSRRPGRRHRVGAEALRPVPWRGVRPAPRPGDHRPRRRVPHRPDRLGRRTRPAHRPRRGGRGRRPRARGRDPRPRDRGRQGAAAAAERRRRQPGRVRGPVRPQAGAGHLGQLVRLPPRARRLAAAAGRARRRRPAACSRWRWTTTPRTPGRGSTPPRRRTPLRWTRRTSPPSATASPTCRAWSGSTRTTGS